jgi:uncharacterized protein YyaL (SSP411 family)
MSCGGIYDHLGGGFARYATDARWLVPHFEKMLCDNAQLLDLLALLEADISEPSFAARIEETVGWLDRDMTAVRGAEGAPFATSEDADSEGEEGRFYVWSEAEIDRLLGAQATAFKSAYGVTSEGNWEGLSILHRVAPPGNVVTGNVATGDVATGDVATETTLAACRATLFDARARRVRPGRDDKVLADWNGLTAAALCRAGTVLARPEWIDRAAACLRFLVRQMRTADGRIQHAWRRGRISAAGQLDDQAATARAALALFEATGQADYVRLARELAAAAETWFADGDGSYFTTAADATDVPLIRPRSAADQAAPSGNGLMAEVLARLYHLTGEAAWRSRAEAVITAFSGSRDNLVGMPTLLAAADLLQNGASVVVTGPAHHPLAGALLAVARRCADPAVAVLWTAGGDLPRTHPAHGKTVGPADAAAYLCRGETCGLPTDDPQELAQQLRRPSPARAGLDSGGG